MTDRPPDQKHFLRLCFSPFFHSGPGCRSSWWRRRGPIGSSTYRNPVSKLSSGYLYHKTGVERWTDSYTLSADAVCGLQTSEAVANKRNPAELCRALKLCKPAARGARDGRPRPGEPEPAAAPRAGAHGGGRRRRRSS